MKSAKDRKRKRPTAVKSGKRSSNVRHIYIEPVKKKRRGRKVKVLLATSKPLSKEALFMDRRPTGVTPIEWHRLYTDEIELWDALADEAKAIIEDGDHIG